MGVELRHGTVGSHQLFEIPFVTLCFDIYLHCAELPNEKMSAAKTNALLPIENGTGRRNSRDQHQQKHQWQPERKRKQDKGKIERRFPPRHLWFGRQFTTKLPPLVTRPTSGR